MTAVRSYLQVNASWLIFYLLLITMASSVDALEIPGIGTVNLPSFKYGKLKRDKDVNQTFQSAEVLPDHKYYISSQANIPYAIIGIENQYKLRQRLEYQ